MSAAAPADRRLFGRGAASKTNTTPWQTVSEAEGEVGRQRNGNLSWDGPDWHLRGEYLSLVPAERVVFTWDWDHDETPARRVDIRLSIVDAGTAGIGVEHDAGSEEERLAYQEGWEFFIPQLREALLSNS